MNLVSLVHLHFCRSVTIIEVEDRTHSLRERCQARERQVDIGVGKGAISKYEHTKFGGESLVHFIMCVT